MRSIFLESAHPDKGESMRNHRQVCAIYTVIASKCRPCPINSAHCSRISFRLSYVAKLEQGQMIVMTPLEGVTMTAPSSRLYPSTVILPSLMPAISPLIPKNWNQSSTFSVVGATGALPIELVDHPSLSCISMPDPMTPCIPDGHTCGCADMSICGICCCPPIPGVCIWS